MRWLAVLFASVAFAQNPGPSVTGGVQNTPPTPSIVGTPTCADVPASVGVYTVSSFTATSGAALFIGVTNGNDDTGGTAFTAITSTAGGVPTSDTFTQISYLNEAFQTTYAYSAFSITGGTYVIKLAGSTASAHIGVCVTQITDVSSVIAHCTGHTTTASGPCSSSITPTATPAVALAVDGSYYIANTYTVSTPYTLGASGASVSNGNAGSFASLYYLCTSSCTSTALTPTFTAATGSFYNTVVGAIYQ
jgi:hypothetical protein